MEATLGKNMEPEDENVVIDTERAIPGFIFSPSYPVYNFESERDDKKQT